MIQPARSAEIGLDPVLDFLRLLWDVEHRLQSTSKQMRAALGVTGPQRLVLRIVSRFPEVSAGEVAEIVRLHPSTITGIIQRLVSKGLLIRKVDPRDSRRVRLTVRSHARPLTRRYGTVEAAVRRAIEGASPVHVQHARLVLAAIAAGLEPNGSASVALPLKRRSHRQGRATRKR
jgi:MarR family transcriptional regulator, organic hydroperoxide resistance regulator